ncbi:MAG: 3-hydroxy-3-methylglutaryl coenzyme A synthase [Trichoglossum hirsutum]|nr:MAG: 3-hydroxy-3-methylglutaryl coenzyme A synthase [Trichoglossum hirsutum]
MSSRPQNIGIKAIEIYFPSQCVDQAELEKFDGVSQGKYTIGLGQTKMSFCDDREDIYSFALTAVSSLLRKYSVDPASIGRLEVGTETLLDKSKSVKSVLMQLFSPSGNTSIEGVDTVNACYGGTNALFNSINWVESSAWDGRDAIVVAGDIALYKKGNARPTGGAGVVAMLVGPNAPLVLEPGLRGSYMQHAYDFYKPDLTSEYPIVDGQFSIKCYTEAVDACYKAYNKREAALSKPTPQMNGHTTNGINGANGHHSINGVHDMLPSDPDKPALDRFNYFVFHAPTCKLVSKSYARLLYNDYLSNPSSEVFTDVPAELRDLDYKKSLSDKVVEKTFMALSKKKFQERVQPSIEVPTMCGNMYCASVYAGLVSLLTNVDSETLQGKRVGVFSYGSGLASSLFSLKIVGPTTEIKEKLDVHARLAARRTVAPEVYDEMCVLREKAHLQKDYKPQGSTETIAKDAYYLTSVDDMFRRQYELKA